MKSGVTTVTDKTKALDRAVRALAEREVVVGIPADKGERKDDAPVSNAELGYIHENGSPANNIPERPFLIPGIRNVQPQIVDQLRAGAQAALDGNKARVIQSLNKAGLIGQNSVRAVFVDNDWPALSEATLNRRTVQRDEDGEVVKRGKTRRERGAVNPLIDSAQLRKSVTFIVRKRTTR